MKKRAIFGGSFNPVHKGHINFCVQCQNAMSFDEILLIPANIPPHKSAQGLVDGEKRIEMLKLAAAEYDYMKICDIELKTEGKSYTIDTVKRLSELYKNDELFLLIGSDMLLTFDEWKNYREIFDYVTLVSAARTAADEEMLIKKRAEMQIFAEKIVVLKLDIIELSSTEIRNALKIGADVSEYINPSVLKYIKENRLYI